MDFDFIKLEKLSVFETLHNLDWQSIKTLLSGWKSGTEGVLSIKKRRKPKSKEQLGYYYALILPMAVDAFLKNEDFSLNIEVGDKKIKVELTRDNMDYFLKQRYAAMTGKYVDKGEMGMAECSAFEDWAIKWLTTWLKVQIPLADKDWNKTNKSSLGQ